MQLESNSIKMDNLSTSVPISNFPDFVRFVNNHCQNNIFLFTSANAEYIPTLVRNLYVSYKQSKQDILFPSPLCLICTDQEGYDKAADITPNRFLIKIDDFPGIEKLTSAQSGETATYRALCFVKVVCAYWLLVLGKTVLYIDPDMVFLQPCLSAIIETELLKWDVIFCGYISNLNTNIMVAQPRSIYVSRFFEVTKAEFSKWVGIEGSSDEAFFAMNPFRQQIHLGFMAEKFFPAGDLLEQYRSSALMLHANCVYGLHAKIALLMKYKGWFLEESLLDRTKIDTRKPVFPTSRQPMMMPPPLTTNVTPMQIEEIYDDSKQAK